MQAESVLRPVA